MLKTLKCFVALGCAVAGAAWAQCPDWSPYFNQIDDPAAVQVLQSERAQGWPNFNPANNGGASLQQSIAAGDQLITQIRQQMQQTYQTWAATRASNTQSIIVSHAQCQTAAGANMAAACEYHNEQNELLGVQGLNDLMRCRAGMPQGSYSAMPGAASSGAGGASPSGGSGNGAYQQGANSVSDGNVAKREGMVSSAMRNWQAPAEQQTPTTTLAQNTSLTDPFADAASNNTDPVSTGGGTSAVDAPNQWTDPLPTEPSTQQSQGDTALSEPPPSKEEIAQTLDQGTANAASTEISATPVAQVTGAPNWDEFANSGNSDDSTGSTITVNQTTDPASSTLSPTVGTNAGDEQLDVDKEMIDADKEALKSLGVFNTNEVSDEIMGQGEDVIFAVAHQDNRLINDMEGALQGDVPPSQLNSDIDNYPRIMFDAALPESAKNLEQDYNTLEQSASNTANWIEAKGGFVYNLISGNWACNDPLFAHDPECKH